MELLVAPQTRTDEDDEDDDDEDDDSPFFYTTGQVRRRAPNRMMMVMMMNCCRHADEANVTPCTVSRLPHFDDNALPLSPSMHRGLHRLDRRILRRGLPPWQPQTCTWLAALSCQRVADSVRWRFADPGPTARGRASSS